MLKLFLLFNIFFHNFTNNFNFFRYFLIVYYDFIVNLLIQ